jgi:hypothetical protein
LVSESLFGLKRCLPAAETGMIPEEEPGDCSIRVFYSDAETREIQTVELNPYFFQQLQGPG